MAIRKPSLFSKGSWAFQDFLDYTNGAEELRYLLVKHDGEDFSQVKQTFDSNPPEFWGGPIVARIDYSLVGSVVTINHWEGFWKDEWPLRLGIQHLVHCLYKQQLGFTMIVDKEQYPFWVSEYFFPLSNDPNDYLVRNF